MFVRISQIRRLSEDDKADAAIRSRLKAIGSGSPNADKFKADLAKGSSAQADANKASRERAKKAAAKKQADGAKKKHELEKQQRARRGLVSKKLADKKANERKKERESAVKEKIRFRQGGPARTSAGDKKADKVPAQLSHCMLALKHKRGKSVRASWNICRWSLTKHGYLKGPYKKDGKIPEATKQTAKGTRRTFQHAGEKKPLGGGVTGSPSSKYNRFVKMFKAIEKTV